MPNGDPADQRLRGRLTEHLEHGRIPQSIVNLYNRARQLAQERRHRLVTVAHLALALAEDPARWGVVWPAEWLPPETWRAEAANKVRDSPRDLPAGAEPCPASDWASLLDVTVEEAGIVTLDQFLTRLVSEHQWCQQHLRTSAVTEMVVDDPYWNQDQSDLQGRGVWFGNQFIPLRDLVDNPARRPGPHQLHGRDDLVRRVGRELEAGSVLVIGPPGVGKTVLIREVARQQLREKKTPIREVVLSRLRTSWMEGAQQLLRELTNWAREKRRTLFIDEFDTLLSIGAHMQNPTGLAMELVPEIDRGLILVGALTYAGLDRLRKDELLEPVVRRVSKVLVPTLTREENLAIFRQALVDRGAEMDDQVLERFGDLGDWLLLRERQPAKGLRWIRAAATVASEERVTETELSQVICAETGLPRFVVTSYLRGDLFALGLAEVEGLREYLMERIQAQDEAVEEVVSLLEERLSLQGRLLHPDRPRAVFLLIGPPGTGKTTLARYVGEYLFEELAERDEPGEGGALVYTVVGQSVSDLLGSRGPGGERGKLAMDMAERPARVVVFDDFERASDMHVLDLFLPMLSEGRVRSARGEEVYFTDAIVVLTTNLKTPEERRQIGFLRDEAPLVSKHELKRKLAELYPGLEPALDRVDRVVRFWEFKEQDLQRVVEAKAKAYNNALRRPLGYVVEMTREAVEHVAKEAFRKRAGAGAAREVERELEDTVYGPARAWVAQERIKKPGEVSENGYWVAQVTHDPERGGLGFKVVWREEVAATGTSGGEGMEGLKRGGAVTDHEKEVKSAYT